MKNPNSPASRLKGHLKARWSAPDYPGGEARFQLGNLVKDVGTYVLIPAIAILLFKGCQDANQSPKRPRAAELPRDRMAMDASRSQIIQFSGPNGSISSSGGTAPRRAPGVLVRVLLLNSVETYSSAPVHAQIVDNALGSSLRGGVLIGDATPDTTFDRISISFRFARDPNREGIAIPINARALSLDGTLGLEATKKEGFVARSALGSASSVSQDAAGKGGQQDFKDILLKALTAGLFQEMGGSTQVARNRAQVLVLPPQSEFFAELTDFFPGGAR